MAMDILRVDSNERVDITDFEFISESVQAHERQMIDNFMCDPAQTRKWVISGFGMSNPAAKQLQVDKGKAILGTRDSGVIQYGVLTTEGDATLTVDLNSYAPGTYGIYIHFERIAGESQSRIFWDPAGSGSEYAQAMNTRYTAAWSLRVESSNPGNDWLKIGEVDQATMAITDQREFYFEGAVVDSYESGWSSDGGGIADDRNVDRATYGVTDLQMALAAVRQCLTDIKGRGLREWYERDIGGLNVGFDAAPVEDCVAIGDNAFYMQLTGAGPDPYIFFDNNDYLQFNRFSSNLALIIGGAFLYQWDGSAFYPGGVADIGKSGSPWPNIYGTTFHPGTLDGEGCGDDWNPINNAAFTLGSATRKWSALNLSGDADIGGDVLVAGGINSGGSVDPDVGAGIFSKGLAVGLDNAVAADTIYLGATSCKLAYAASTLSLDATNNCRLFLNGLSDVLDFYMGGNVELQLNVNSLDPYVTSGLSLGTVSKEWLDIFAVDATLSNQFQIHDSTSSYWAMHVYGQNLYIGRTANDYTSMKSSIRCYTSAEDTVDCIELYGGIISLAGTVPITSWTKSNQKSIDVTANQDQRGWIELEINGIYPAGTNILIPYWHKADVTAT